MADPLHHITDRNVLFSYYASAKSERKRTWYVSSPKMVPLLMTSWQRETKTFCVSLPTLPHCYLTNSHSSWTFMRHLHDGARPHMSRASIACSSVDNLSLDLRRAQSLRCASRTDTSTGIRFVPRGLDLTTEEGGVAVRRMQTNLSEWRQSSRNLPLLP